MKKFHLTYKVWNGQLGIEEFKTHVFESENYETAWRESYDTFGHCLVKLKQL